MLSIWELRSLTSLDAVLCALAKTPVVPSAPVRNEFRLPSTPDWPTLIVSVSVPEVGSAPAVIVKPGISAAVEPPAAIDRLVAGSVLAPSGVNADETLPLESSVSLYEPYMLPKNFPLMPETQLPGWL